jgi:putative ABC transport system permease protein
MEFAALRQTWRVLWRRPVFTLISLFGITCTLATLTVVTAMLDHSFGHHPPSPDPRTTLGIYTMRLGSESFVSTGNAGYAFLDRYIRTLTIPKRVVLASTAEQTAVFHDDRKIGLYLRRVEPEFWQITEFQFLAGQPFSADDDRAGRLVAVLNQATCQQLFTAEGCVDREFEFEGRLFRVVGVVPNVSFASQNVFADIWLPLGSMLSSSYQAQFRGGFQALVELPSSESKESARAELAMRLKEVQLPQGYTEIQTGLDTPFEAVSRELLSDDYSNSHAELLLGILMLLALLFMVLPATNLANLSTSRMLERASEIGVRKAFGATRGRLIIQLLLENLVLTGAGALAAIPLSLLVLAVFNRSSVIPYADLGINLRVLGWGAVAAAVFGVLSGIYPAWRLSRLQPVAAMKGVIS